MWNHFLCIVVYLKIKNIFLNYHEVFTFIWHALYIHMGMQSYCIVFVMFIYFCSCWVNEWMIANNKLGCYNFYTCFVKCMCSDVFVIISSHIILNPSFPHAIILMHLRSNQSDVNIRTLVQIFEIFPKGNDSYEL